MGHAKVCDAFLPFRCTVRKNTKKLTLPNTVDGSWNGYFFRLAHVSKDMKHMISTRYLAGPN